MRRSAERAIAGVWVWVWAWAWAWAWDGAVEPEVRRSWAIAISRCLSILPTGVRGQWVRASAWSGSLNVLRPRSRRASRRPPMLIGVSCGGTKAQIRSPSKASGTPTTAASRTPGSWPSANSTSAAEVFSPPRWICSLMAASTIRLPAGSRRTRTPVPQVGGGVGAVAGEAAGIVLGCAVVAANGVGASGEQLPYLARGHILIVLVHDAHLVLRRERASLGVDDGVLRIVEPGAAQQS